MASTTIHTLLRKPQSARRAVPLLIPVSMVISRPGCPLCAQGLHLTRDGRAMKSWE